MQKFKSVEAGLFDFSPFRLIGKDWMLITAEKGGKVNCMTAGWGGLGVMWGKNVAYIVIRNSRYTKELVDGSDTFSLSFFDHQKYSKMLNYMGTVSGSDKDKIKSANVTVEYYEYTPYIVEASTVIICKKMYCQPMKPEGFTMDWIDEKWYKDKDYHNLYIGEVVDILMR